MRPRPAVCWSKMVACSVVSLSGGISRIRFMHGSSVRYSIAAHCRRDCQRRNRTSQFWRTCLGLELEDTTQKADATADGRMHMLAGGPGHLCSTATKAGRFCNRASLHELVDVI